MVALRLEALWLRSTVSCSTGWSCIPRYGLLKHSAKTNVRSCCRCRTYLGDPIWQDLVRVVQLLELRVMLYLVYRSGLIRARYEPFDVLRYAFKCFHFRLL